MKASPLFLALAALISFGVCRAAEPYGRDTKARVEKELRIELKAKASFKTPETTLEQGPHVLALMNFSSTWTCIAVSLDNAHWANIAAPVGRTCQRPASEADRCYIERKYLPIGKVNCGQPILVWLKFRNEKGDIGTLTNPYHLIPNCTDKGTAILFGE